MITAAPETVVAAPPLRAAPTGLLQAATVVDMTPTGATSTVDGLDVAGFLDAAGNERWLAGVRYSPESVAIPALIDPCAVQTSDNPVYSRSPVRYHHPLIIEVEDQCGDFGYLANDYEARALRALQAKEQIALEREFEAGTKFPTEPYLSDGVKVYADGGTTAGSATVTSGSWSANDLGRAVTGTGIPASTTVTAVTPGVSAVLSKNATANGTAVSLTVTNPNFQILNGGAAVTPQIALAYLQEAIAEATIGQGMCHVSAFLAERLAENHALRFSPTGQLTSANGNLIVAGNGYRGVGWAGAPAVGGTVNSQTEATATQWAYATDLITILRAATPTLYPPGDTATERLRSALDRSTGLITYRQSRPYVVEWAGLCHAAVLVDVTA